MATEVDAAAAEATPQVVENTTVNPASEGNEEQEPTEKKESSHSRTVARKTQDHEAN